MMKKADSAETLRRFVRGQSSFESLEEVGIKIQISKAAVSVQDSNRNSFVVSMLDVAIGILTLKDKFQDLKCWAIALLGCIDLFDFDDEFEFDPRGDCLLGALWDLSRGERIDGATLEIAREISGRD